MQATLPPCIFCELPIREKEPVIPTSFLYSEPTADGALVGTTSIHVHCFIATIAGETARAVLVAIQSGDVDVGLAREDDSDLRDVVTDLLDRQIDKFMKRRTR